MNAIKSKQVIFNRTSHSVDIVGANGQEVCSFAPAELAARVTILEINLVDGIDGIPITETKFGEVENLPEFKEGVFYIVSQMVKNALPNRKDLLVPTETVRDRAGRVIGCRSLGR